MYRYPIIQTPVWYQNIVTSIPAPPPKPRKPYNEIASFLDRQYPPFKYPFPPFPFFIGTPSLLLCIVLLIVSIYFKSMVLMVGFAICILISINYIFRKIYIKHNYQKILLRIRNSGLTTIEYFVSEHDPDFKVAIEHYYEEILPQWYTSLEKYNKKKEFKFRDTDLFDFRNSQIAHVRVSPVKIHNFLSFNRKGICEDFFYIRLKHYFAVLKKPFEILRNTSIGDLVPQYYPDITVKVSDNFIFDIEIDEPYSLETRLPIHYLEIDFERNKFFIESGWFVLRFTEYQILFETASCVVIIDEVITNALNLKESLLPNKTTITFTNCWTYSEGVIFASENLRENYFSEKMKDGN